ncbi:MAG: glycerol kinase GlpK [Clostridia bacterium]|nr:glycerol kinase GlpK [Clostridia bacterium]
MKYVLSLDQGTTSSRAIIFDRYGNIISSAQREFKQLYPAAGWVEHSPADIYGTVVSVAAEALARASVSAEDICALGITNQRETTLVWDRHTGEPVCNAIVWQCRRTADCCERLKAEGLSDLIYEKTGLVPDAYFSATKLKWILDNIPSARNRAESGGLLFGTVDTYLMWKLSKGRIFATDYTNAARTMLFNIHTLEWDEELLKLFTVPRQMLPEVKPSGSDFGCTDKSVFGFGIPVCSAVGDQQSALFGQLCLNEGDVKNTYGTGCFLLMNTGNRAVKSKSGLITTLGAAIAVPEKTKPPYVLEGSVFAGGAAVQWLRDGLKIISSADESQILASQVKDNGGVYFVPALTGLGAPYWNSEARGTVTGLTRGTTRAHIVRAVLEGIAYQVCDVVEAMQNDAQVKICRLAVDGGASKNDFLLQFQADILNCPTERPKVFETTALGAAYLAGLYSGFWKSVDELKNNLTANAVFNPAMSGEKRKQNLEGWRKAVSRTLL